MKRYIVYNYFICQLTRHVHMVLVIYCIHYNSPIHLPIPEYDPLYSGGGGGGTSSLCTLLERKVREAVRTVLKTR